MKKLAVLIFVCFLISCVDESDRDVYFEGVYSGCSETSYCADGFTTKGIDRNGNLRGYVYPKKEIFYEQYLAADKEYDHEGYNQFGFDRIDRNRGGLVAKDMNVINY